MDFNIVLVKTKYPLNIGACARAMSNMGGKQLVLINPASKINADSYKGAAGAQKTLDETQIFNTWEEYLKFYPNSLKVGFTARSGKKRTCLKWAEVVENKITNASDNLHLIFGPEDHGLSEEDLTHCNYPAYLETYGDFKSLNISQAVLLAGYVTQSSNKKTRPLNRNSKNAFLNTNTLKNWLEATGFNLASPKENAHTILKKYFNRSPLQEKEKNLLEKAFQQSLRKLNQK